MALPHTSEANKTMNATSEYEIGIGNDAAVVCIENSGLLCFHSNDSIFGAFFSRLFVEY